MNMMDKEEKQLWTNRLTKINEERDDGDKNPIVVYCTYYCDHMKNNFQRPCIFTNNSIKSQGLLKTANEQCPFKKDIGGGEVELKKNLGLIGITVSLKDTVKP